MPTYDFVCGKCRHEWSAVMTLGEHERKPRPACPKCGSKQVHQKVSRFMAVTGKKA